MNRFLSASENSVIILRGAFLYGEYMNTVSSSSEYERVSAAWEAWSHNHTDQIVQKAQQLQQRAFDYALGAV